LTEGGGVEVEFVNVSEGLGVELASREGVGRVLGCVGGGGRLWGGMGMELGAGVWGLGRILDGRLTCGGGLRG